MREEAHMMRPRHDPQLVGPFEAYPSDPDGFGFQIADANGVVVVWVIGERIARRLAQIMTLADRCGKF